MSPTVWVMVAMVYAGGEKHKCYAQTEFPTSSQCIMIEDAVNRQWIMERKGWAMCLPKDRLGQLKPC